MQLIFFIIFVIGLSLGSFASVVIHRLHKKEKGILWGRSKCPKCEHNLNAIDLIPVLGAMLNRLKCRYCKKKISLHYPILELVMGSTFVLTTMLVGLDKPYILAYYLVITFVFILLSFYDIFFQEIPDEISLPTIILTGLVSFFAGLHSGSSLLIGFLVPVLFFGSLFIGSGGRWLGGGDIRVGAIMGLTLGWPNILTGLFFGYLIGSVYSGIGLVSGKLSRKSPIPFGPFLFLGNYIALFWGQSVIEWYLSLM